MDVIPANGFKFTSTPCLLDWTGRPCAFSSRVQRVQTGSVQISFRIGARMGPGSSNASLLALNLTLPSLSKGASPPNGTPPARRVLISDPQTLRLRNGPLFCHPAPKGKRNNCTATISAAGTAKAASSCASGSRTLYMGAPESGDPRERVLSGVGVLAGPPSVQFRR